MRTHLTPLASLIGPLCVTVGACSGGADGDSIAWQTTRDTVGDTIIVRTVSGSAWGSTQLVEEARIGVLDGPDEYTFGRISAIDTGPDGTYLGQIAAPRGFARSPRPAIAGHRMWAVVRDELDVPSVVRFRIVPGGNETPESVGGPE